MGSFYTSHTLRGPEQADVIAWLGTRPAFVSATQARCTTVLDEECESQDPAALASLGKELSAHFACPVLAVLNHDDDVFYFALYENGVKTDQYNSNPGFGAEDEDEDTSGGACEPVGGNAARLADAFGGDAAAVEAALRAVDVVFAVERHQALATALGLPAASVGIGFNYASEGEFPESVPADTYRAVGR